MALDIASSMEQTTVTFELKDVNLHDQGKNSVGMKDFELLKVLGTGAYGKVFLVRKIGGADDKKLYAMKVLKKAAIVQKTKTTEHTKTERQVLEVIRQSPFLVTLHYAFQTKAKLHLILDYVNGGELFTHLNQHDKFTEKEVRIYIGEIVLALETLHRLGIIYRDIKLENLLLDNTGHIILTDFGLSKEFLPTENHRAYSFCGTIEYMAPEVVEGGRTGHNYVVDWWSLGVLTYELLTGASPFTVDGEKNTQSEISRRILKANPPMPSEFSSEVRDFIQKLLTKDPNKRLGSDGTTGIKKHKFFKGVNWDRLAQKEVPAPFVPKIDHELDTGNFADEFIRMDAIDSPAIIPMDSEKIFKGYSYIAPSIIFSENMVSSELLTRSTENQPVDHKIQLARHFKNSTFFQHYDIDLKKQPLGDGSFSICRECYHKKLGTKYAVKIVSKRVDCSREVRLLKLCQGHPNIVDFIEVHQDEYHVYIVLELLKGGELLDRIRKKKSFTEPEASEIMWKLVKAVHFMHSKGVVHRDLKPENLLFQDATETANIKIVDFGFACRKPEKQMMQTPCFSLPYAAPEVLPGKMLPRDGYDESCDLWSLGVILYTMLSGKVPFQTRGKADNASAIMNRIKVGEFDFSGAEWDDVSQPAKALIQGLLTVEPRKRLTMDNLLQIEWLTGNNSEVFSATPLRTPGVLCQSLAVHQQLSVTMGAFQKATREGFRLQDVNKAPLARRRKDRDTRKNSSGGEPRSGSSDSNNSSSSSGTIQSDSTSQSDSTPPDLLADRGLISIPVRNLSDVSNGSNTSQGSTYSTGFVPNNKGQITLADDSGQLTQVLDNSQSSSILIRSPSTESDDATQLFQASRGTKRKHDSLGESGCSSSCDAEEDDDCVIMVPTTDVLTVTLDSCSKASPIVIDD
ncbi:ribosomal protein S6 kinase alpha-5-like [Mizuhopecten yessoensis]|uniref:non-specific serine/threonine protein kinase n=1 Tax=Mizuhopecten yessoensis TaxID=6573 RepID=A0A210PW71_MIZYE|nr:ribosomal protein S6 kinase alpha-5-like [Mizuhopecten yessoensis]OWF40715.1 Ribosomal protein S6 kinase alpha-5 [Mizuhopecten yessoensis]